MLGFRFWPLDYLELKVLNKLRNECRNALGSNGPEAQEGLLSVSSDERGADRTSSETLLHAGSSWHRLKVSLVCSLVWDERDEQECQLAHCYEEEFAYPLGYSPMTGNSASSASLGCMPRKMYRIRVCSNAKIGTT